MQIRVNPQQIYRFSVVFNTFSAAEDFAAELQSAEGVLAPQYDGSVVRFYAFNEKAARQLIQDFERRWLESLMPKPAPQPVEEAEEEAIVDEVVDETIDEDEYFLDEEEVSEEEESSEDE